MTHRLSRWILLGTAAFAVLGLMSGCSSPEKPKAEAGGTYYEGPIHGQKKPQ